MDSIDMSFEALTRETLELSNYLSEHGWDAQVSNAHQIDLSEQLFSEIEEDSYPDLPGVVFRIDRGLGTFCLRGVATKSVADSMKVVKTDETLTKKLKISDDEDCDDIRFFACETYEQAEVIRDQLFQRRFPIVEDVVCNVGDPSYSWWMDLSENKMRIFYQSISVDRNTALTKLGPIGDGKVAAKCFVFLENALSKVIPSATISSENRVFTIECSDGSPLFKEFCDLFLTGRDIFKGDDFIFLKTIPTIYYYLNELSILRRFWLSVEKDVESKGSSWLC